MLYNQPCTPTVFTEKKFWTIQSAITCLPSLCKYSIKVCKVQHFQAFSVYESNFYSEDHVYVVGYLSLFVFNVCLLLAETTH